MPGGPMIPRPAVGFFGCKHADNKRERDGRRSNLRIDLYCAVKRPGWYWLQRGSIASQTFIDVRGVRVQN